MNKKLILAVISTVLMSATGLVFAGPGEKNAKVVIQHTPPSDSNNGAAIEEGSVELEVSLPAAINHIANHADDCVVPGYEGELDGAPQCDDDGVVVE